jgi:hypothetical protein
MRCDNLSRTVVKRARGALAALGLLAGALGLVAPSSAAAQAIVIELSTAAPPITHRAKPGPLIEVVALESQRRPAAAIEQAETGVETPVAFVPPPEVTAAPAVEVEAPVAAAAPLQLDARFVAASERRLAQLRAVEPGKLDAVLRKLERSGQVEVLARPRLVDENASAAVTLERPADIQDGSRRPYFQAYGAELKLRPNLGDGLLHVELKAEVDGDAKGLETGTLREGQTLVMSAVSIHAEAARLDPPRADLLSRMFAKRPEPQTQLAVIVTAKARDVAEPPVPLQLDHAPRGPPQRTGLAGLAGKAWRLMEAPYRGAKAVLSAIGMA